MSTVRSVLLFTILLSLTACLVQGQDAKSRMRLPRFEDFNVANPYKGKPAAIDITSPGARYYRTRLREAEKGKPNFAGHYIITDWGCGTECFTPVAIDARNGKVYLFDFSVGYSPLSKDSPMEYHLNSRLIIINGYLEDAHGKREHGTYYYKWQNNRLVLLKFLKKPFLDFK
jgi:hypothetical protein